MDIQTLRRENLRKWVSENSTPVKEKSYFSQLLSGSASFGERSARRLESEYQMGSKFLDTPLDASRSSSENANTSASGELLQGNFTPIVAHDEDDPDFVEIRKVKLKLAAGIVGFNVEVYEDDGVPISFRKTWLEDRGYNPGSLVAVKVKGESMEPTLHEGDTVVINTADRTPKDGVTFAVNYEGEPVVKRLSRDMGEWWLSSDNTDQRRFHRKICRGNDCLIIGRVIHKQSEVI